MSSNRRLCIQNKGEIEDGAFTLLGASTKEGQDKIGFFGSGNKYALAVLLRNKIPFDIYSGRSPVIVDTESVTFGGQMYDRIVVNGSPTSFTTRMGPSWEPWFAIREIICNAIDEGEYSYNVIECKEEDDVKEGFTSIYIGPSEEVDAFIDNMSDYILQTKAIEEVDTVYGKVGVHYLSPDGRFSAFRKGIRATPLSDERFSIFKYNFENIEINESRLIQYFFHINERIAKFFMNSHNSRVIGMFLKRCNENTLLEYSVGFQYEAGPLSQAWREAIGDHAIASRGIAENMPNEDLQNVYIVPDALSKIIASCFPDVCVYGSDNKPYEVVDKPLKEWVEMADRALTECVSFGLDLMGYDIQFVKFFRPQVMANCNRETRKISLSIHYMNDYDELVSTLYEELSHTKGYSDCTRDFEQYLIGEIISAKREIAFMKRNS